jgi:hypothetical protein
LASFDRWVGLQERRCLLSLKKTVTLSVHFHNMKVMREPIQQRSRELFRAARLGPFVERSCWLTSVAAFIAAAEDLE